MTLLVYSIFDAQNEGSRSVIHGCILTAEPRCWTQPSRSRTCVVDLLTKELSLVAVTLLGDSVNSEQSSASTLGILEVQM